MVRLKKPNSNRNANNPQFSVAPAHENDYSSLLDDVLAEKISEAKNDSDDDDEYGERGGRGRKDRHRREDEEQEEKPPPYMLFDFRRGPTEWPKNVELVDPKRCEELVEKATKAAGDAFKSQNINSL